MRSSEWIAVIALAVSIVFGGLSWSTARRAAAAAVKSAEESGKSREAAQRAVALSERAEGRAVAEREDARGPVFHVGDQESRTGTALATLHDDEAQVPIAQVAGPDLEVVMIKARGLTDGIDRRVGDLTIGGAFTEWERPILHVPTTVSVYSETTATSFTFELVLECVEREPGDGCWDRRYTVQAIDRVYGPRLGSTGALNSARVEGTSGGLSGGHECQQCATAGAGRGSPAVATYVASLFTLCQPPIFMVTEIVLAFVAASVNPGSGKLATDGLRCCPESRHNPLQSGCNGGRGGGDIRSYIVARRCR